MRALFASYENQLLTGNYILVAKITLHDRTFSELKKDFDFALKRLEVLKWKSFLNILLDFIKNI